MADNVIDSLELQVKTTAQQANAQLELMCKKLSKVQTSLASAQNNGLEQFSRGVTKLANAVNGISSIKTTEFTRLAKNLNQLGSVNAVGIRSTASAIQSMAAQLNGIQSMSFDAAGLANLANSIGKLGGNYVTQASANLPVLRQNLVAFVQALNGIGTIGFDISGLAQLTVSLSSLGKTAATNAVTNIPLLATALRDMMTTLSTAPQVSQNLISMTNALAGLAAQGSRIPSVYNRMTRAQNAYTTSTKAAKKASQTLAQAIGTLYAKYFIVVRGFQALWKSIEAATDYVETLNYFEVAVNKVASEGVARWSEFGHDSADDYYNSFRDRMTALTEKFTGYEVGKNSLTLSDDMAGLGMNVSDILNYQATYLQMADSMGVVEETAYNVSSALTMLAGDWSSLKNIDLDVSMNKFSSALAGQTRAVRSLGIDILQATLQEYAYKHGIDDSIQSMTQAAKVQLRLLAILDQSEVAYGDLADTISQPANQIRVLQNNLQNLSRTLGSLFLPIVQTVLPYINGLTIAFNRMLTNLGNFIGVDWSSSITSIGDSAAEIDDFGDSIDETADAAERLNKAIRGWDELNVLSENKGGNDKGVSTGGYAELDLAIAKALAEYQAKWDEAFDNMDNKADNIADSIGGSFENLLTKAEPTIKAINGFYIDVIKPLGEMAFSNLESLYTNFLKPVGGWVLGEDGIPKLINAFTDGFKNADLKEYSDNCRELWKNLAPFAKSVGKGLIDFLSDTAEVLGENLAGLINGLSDAMEWLNEKLEDADPKTIEAVGAALGSLLAAFAVIKVTSRIIEIGQNSATAIKAIGLAIKAHPIIAGAVAFAGLTAFLYSLYENSKGTAEIREYAEAVGELLKTLDGAESSTEEAITKVNSKYEAIKKVADAYYLMSKNYDTLTEAEKLLLDQYKNTLVEYCPELVGSIETVTGAFKGQKEELDAALEAAKLYYMTIAGQDVMTDLSKKLFNVNMELAENKKLIADTEQAMRDKRDELYRTMAPLDKQRMEGMGINEPSLKGDDFRLLFNTPLYEDYLALQETEKELMKSQEMLNDEITEAQKIYNDTQKQLDEFTKSLEKNTEATATAETTLVGFGDSIDIVNEFIRESLKEQQNAVGEQAFSLGEAIPDSIASGITSGLPKLSSAFSILSHTGNSDLMKKISPTYSVNIPDYSSSFAAPNIDYSKASKASSVVGSEGLVDRFDKRFSSLERQLQMITPNVTINNSADPNGIIKTTVEANKKAVSRTGKSLYAY